MGYALSPDPGHYSGVLAVDVRGFSEHTDAGQDTIVRLLPEILEQAAERANIRDLMQENRFRAFRGDGYLIGIDPRSVSAVVENFFDALQAELRRRRAELRSLDVEIRLRTSLHLGPVQPFDQLISDSPTGTVTVEAVRMVDAPQLRALLDRSDPAVTMVAVALSDEVIKHVVGAGHTERRATEFVPTPVRIEEKDFTGFGHLRVPVPSGDLLKNGLLNHLDRSDPADAPGGQQSNESPPSNAPAANSFPGSANNATQARDIGGGVRGRSAHAESGGIAVQGNGNTTSRGDIDQSTNKQEFSGQFNTRGDANFGPSSGQRITGAHQETTDE